MKKIVYFIFILNILCLGGCGLLEENIKENDEEIVVDNTLVSEMVQSEAVKNEKEPDISISAKSWEIINRANSNLRDGYEEVKLSYVDASQMGWNYYSDNALSSKEEREALAQVAIKELYTLTGNNIKECIYYYTDGISAFVFSSSPENFQRHANIYYRDYGFELAGDRTPMMSWRLTEPIPYENLLVDNAVDGEAVSQQETVLLQFLGQSGVYRGQKIEACEVIYPETAEYSYFHLNFSGGYYEVITDKTGQFLISILGPHYDKVDELPTPAYLIDIKDEVYQNLITEMVETGVFPMSGTQCGGMPYGQSYAVVDIDEDGHEELIINYANASATAGMVYYIYDYDRATGEAYIEHAGWPHMSFYDNGYVKEEASHNHGRSNLDDFWPYHLLVYNPEMDEYESVTHVDAWQKELYPKDFPEKMDVDGDGIVYYTASSSYIPTDFMDKAEYDIWCEQFNTGIIKKIQWKPIMTEADYVAIYMQDAVG